MSTWDSAYLLSMFQRKAGMPPATATTTTTQYQRLSESQNRVVAMLSGVAPYSLYPKVAYGSLPTLTTSDNQIFTFGTDSNGYGNFPMGRLGIFRSLNDIPSNPMREGRDFLNEGTQIRIPNNGTYTGTLYAYGMFQPADISADSEPALLPEASRELIVIDAVRQYAKEYARNAPLVALMQDEWDRAWPQWCLVWKTQFRQGGALNVVTGLQLALGAQYTGFPY